VLCIDGTNAINVSLDLKKIHTAQRHFITLHKDFKHIKFTLSFTPFKVGYILGRAAIISSVFK